LADLVSLKRPPAASRLRGFARSLSLALRAHFSRKEQEPPRVVVEYPEKFNRGHRRSSSDPFSSLALTGQRPRSALAAVLEEASLRGAQSDLCLLSALPSDSESSSATSRLALEALRPIDTASLPRFTSTPNPRNSVTGSCPSRLPFPSVDSGDSFLDDNISNGSNTLSPARIITNLQRRSSDSDLSITPKGKTSSLFLIA